MAQLEISSIDKFYGATQALFDVSLTVRKGEFVTLLGPSGSGKTTLLKILAGFESVSAGRITLNGRDVTALAPERRNFGLVFQGYALFPHMTVFDNVAYPLRVRRIPRDEIAQRVAEMLDLVQLSRFAQRKPAALSGGQQQRVALARALVFRPDLLLLDEPMSALDKKLRGDLQEQLRDIHRSLGTTFINVTHDQEEAMHMSDTIAIMNHGRIEQAGSAFALYRHPGSRFVAEFVGKSNFLGGRADHSGNQPVFVTGSARIPLAGPGLPPDGTILMIRPEDVVLNPPDAQTNLVRLPAKVLSSTYSGDRALYTLAAEGLPPLLAYGHAREGLHDNGGAVTVGLSGDGAVLLSEGV
ncbi:MAG: ABC transporter ATP-binding protein [Gemmobacter sp.]|jgi:ABC-type Fe3+/spermidine/putrescine transport system ATPase subunit|nr:ABC transporter ATP-binding protein [Gemmobacter sp.]